MSNNPHVENFWGEYNELISEVVYYHLSIEALLEKILRERVPNPQALSFDRMMFAQKANLVWAFGFIEEGVFRALKSVNQLRNKLAHQIDYSPTFEDIHAITSQVGKAGVEFTDDVDASVSHARKLEYTESDLLNATFRNLFFHIAFEQGENFWPDVID